MKKQQYIAAVACLVAGAIGFAGVYATEKGQERKNNQQNIAQETQQTSPASYEVVPKKTVEKEKKVTVVKKDETKSVAEEKKSESAEKTKETAATLVPAHDRPGGQQHQAAVHQHYRRVSDNDMRKGNQ